MTGHWFVLWDHLPSHTPCLPGLSGLRCVPGRQEVGIRRKTVGTPRLAPQPLHLSDHSAFPVFSFGFVFSLVPFPFFSLPGLSPSSVSLWIWAVPSPGPQASEDETLWETGLLEAGGPLRSPLNTHWWGLRWAWRWVGLSLLLMTRHRGPVSAPLTVGVGLGELQVRTGRVSRTRVGCTCPVAQHPPCTSPVAMDTLFFILYY